MSDFDRPWLRALYLLVGISLGVVAVSLGFEHLGNMRPCWLCLIERYAYYFAVLAGALALMLARADVRRGVWLLAGAIALAYAVNAGIGVYHAGAEWKWWAGPASCGGALGQLSGTGGGLLDLAAPAIRCDQAAWRSPLVELSFAGWNAVISTGLSVLALQIARVARAAARLAVLERQVAVQG